MKHNKVRVMLVITVILLVTLAGTQIFFSLKSVNARQVDSLQCGQWCLIRTAHVLGLPLSAEKAVEILPHQRTGHTMLDIKNALHGVGFAAKPVKAELGDVLRGPLPALLHLRDPDHYVVAVSSANDRLLIFDARGQRQRIRPSSVAKRFSGYALQISRDSSKTLPPNRKPGAQVQFASLYNDQGDVPQSVGKMEYSYPLRNTGTEPLVIRGLHSDCACLEVTGPDSIPPGSGGVVTATFRKNPDAKNSFFQHKILVESNDADFPTIALIAAGNTRTTVRVSPFRVNINKVPDRQYLFVSYDGENADHFSTVTATSSVPGVSARIISVDDYRRQRLIRFPTTAWSDPSMNQKVVEVTYASLDGRPLPSNGTVIVSTSVPGFEQIVVPCSVRVNVSPVTPKQVHDSVLKTNPARAEQ